MRNHSLYTTSFHHSFGMSMVSYSNAEFNYSYGMNTQEKDDEIYGKGNSYSAEYWQYDARLGRRWNNDPRPNPSISVYACFGNNPIWFSDVAGDTIKTFGAEEETLLNDYNTLIDNQIQAHQNEIEQLTNEILGGNLTNEQIQTKTELIVQKQIVLDKWLEVRRELNDLEISTDVYMIRLGRNVSQRFDNADGNFAYNPTTKQFDVNVIGGNLHSFQLTDLQILGHELKHAHQFHKKQLAFHQSSNLFGYAIGITRFHEIEAHKRQQIIFNATGTGKNIKNISNHVNTNYSTYQPSSYDFQSYLNHIYNDDWILYAYKFQFQYIFSGTLNYINNRK